MHEVPPDDALAFETPRLVVRPLVSSDALEMFHVLRDPALGEFTGDLPPASPAALGAVYARWSARRSPDGQELWLNWIARLRPDDRAIAHLQATVADRTARVAWVVDRRDHRRGYATEAARGMAVWLRDTLGVTRLVATIVDGHVASEGVARNLGLVVTADVEDGERVWRGPVPAAASP
jgi:RimJ/RimL family protein N-acetyltransferase